MDLINLESIEAAQDVQDHFDALDTLATSMEGLARIAASLESIAQLDGQSAEFLKLALESQISLIGLEDTLPSVKFYNTPAKSKLATTVSVESVKQTLANVWQALVQMARRVWTAIMNAIHKLTGRGPATKARHESLREKIAAYRDGDYNDMVTVPHDVAKFLAVGDKPFFSARTADDVVRNLSGILAGEQAASDLLKACAMNLMDNTHMVGAWYKVGDFAERARREIIRHSMQATAPAAHLGTAGVQNTVGAGIYSWNRMDLPKNPDQHPPETDPQFEYALSRLEVLANRIHEPATQKRVPATNEMRRPSKQEVEKVYQHIEALMAISEKVKTLQAHGDEVMAKLETSAKSHDAMGTHQEGHVMRLLLKAYLICASQVVKAAHYADVAAAGYQRAIEVVVTK